jgi:hypothetical protein
MPCLQAWRHALPDLLAFISGLGMAFLLRWEVRDLVWSLWLSSLISGYATLLATFVAGACVGLRVLNDINVRKALKLSTVLAGILVGLFFLGFFSLHFCGFHAGHSVFLQSFFPLDKVPRDGFGAVFTNPVLLLTLAFKHLMKPYGLFVIPVLISEREQVLKPLFTVIRSLRGNDNPPTRPDTPPIPSKRLNPDVFGTAMTRPYRNVVRMHLLIFFFAACHFLKIDSFTVYAVVYAVYFFPWRILRTRQTNDPAPETQPPEPGLPI